MREAAQSEVHDSAPVQVKHVIEGQLFGWKLSSPVLRHFILNFNEDFLHNVIYHSNERLVL